MDDWVKLIFRDEYLICTGNGDKAGTFVWCRANKMYTHIYQPLRSGGIWNKVNFLSEV